MTRAQRRLGLAWIELVKAAWDRGGWVRPLDGWLEANFGAGTNIMTMTTAQARTARRRLNAWRGSLVGYPTVKPARARKKR